MKGLAVALAGAIIAAALVIAFAPATLLDAEIARATDGRLRLAEASGTLWRGGGFVAESQGRWRTPVAWHLDPWSLLRNEVDLALTGPSAGAMRGHVRVQDDAIALDTLDVTLPAAVVATLAGADDARLGGELRVRTDALALSPGAASGIVDARWSGARAAAWPGMTVDLGTVTARLSASTTGLAGPIEARGGAMQADGTASLAADAVSLDAELTAAPGAPDSVRQALALLGTPDARGAVRLAVRRAR